MQERQYENGLRELRLAVPDMRLESVRERIAAGVGRLDRAQEDEALNWIETVSEFDGSVGITPTGQALR